MQQQGITLRDLFRQYWFRLQDIVVRVGRRSVAWEEVFTDGLNPPLDGIIQVWTDRTYLPTVVRAGYTALLSAGWYLDRQLPVGEDVTHYCPSSARAARSFGALALALTCALAGPSDARDAGGPGPPSQS